MNVFLSGPSVVQSFERLDRLRLGKQRVELKQILLALENGGAWSSHPATKMWTGCRGFVAKMGVTCCLVWRARGYKDSLLPWFTVKAEEWSRECVAPQWLETAREKGDCEFFEHVRGNLIRKDSRYNKFWPNTQPREGYTWPQP